MNLEKLQELVGKAKFEEAAQSMAEEAANLMRWRGGGRSSDLPYELSAIIWLEPMALIKRIELIFDVYEQIPSYGLLAGIAAQRCRSQQQGPLHGGPVGPGRRTGLPQGQQLIHGVSPCG